MKKMKKLNRRILTVSFIATLILSIIGIGIIKLLVFLI